MIEPFYGAGVGAAFICFVANYWMARNAYIEAG
jgi:hypothetical protein